ncbi:DNA-binding protein [Rothia nasimurium]|uniref:DNA-binding protein n=1 Tax=Rothia nasimurium TaxID=85336 RepID=A0A4Y9F0H4_9MICC|nr:helix-turn-helix domain-containing protein [Rothia nasimurium]MBF0809226.1 helix-turn-helix domain-containing protein [Rothia nasimurium]TFU20368.1 DNA-binding protein [Rothia nasimurium]
MTTTQQNQRSTLEPSTFNEADLELLSAFLHRAPSGIERTPPALLSPDGKKQVIPFPIYETLTAIVDALTRNQAVSIIPTNTKLTTQQAADYLQISRPTLIKALEAGAIPFTLVGRHRRVLLTDLIHYEENLRAKRKAFLKEQTHESATEGSYFDTPASFDTRPFTEES